MDKKKSVRDKSEKRQVRQTQMVTSAKSQHPLNSPPTPKQPPIQDSFVQTEQIITRTSATDSEPPATLSLFTKKDIDIVADALQGMVNSLRTLEKRDIATPLEVQLGLKNDVTILKVSSASEERTVKLPHNTVLENELKITVDDSIRVFLGENEVKNGTDNSVVDPYNLLLSDTQDISVNLTNENKTLADSVTLSKSIQTDVSAKHPYRKPHLTNSTSPPLIALAVDALHHIWQTDSGVENVLFSIKPVESIANRVNQFDTMKARVKCPVYTMASKSHTDIEALNDKNVMKAMSDDSVRGNRKFLKRSKIANNFEPVNPFKKLTTTETQTERNIGSNIYTDDKYLHFVLDLTSKENTGVPGLSPATGIPSLEGISEIELDSWQEPIKTTSMNTNELTKPPLSPSKSELLTWTRVDACDAPALGELRRDLNAETVTRPLSCPVRTSPTPLNREILPPPTVGRVIWTLTPKSVKTNDSTVDHPTMVAVDEENEEISEDEEVNQGALWTDPYWN